MLPCHTGGAGEKVAGVLRWTKKVSRCVIRKRERKKVKRPIVRKGSLLEKRKRSKKRRKEKKREMTGKEQMEELCKELVEELRSGVIRGLGEGLARRGMSQAIFKRMGGPEVWARVSKVGVRRGGGEGKKEEEGELKKVELCEFLSRVIRGRELGMSGKEKMSAVGLYMRLKGWDKVKEKEEEMVGEELVELLGGRKGGGEKNDTEEG